MVNGCFQLSTALMHPTAQLLLRQQPKPSLHQVQPGCAGGSEVQVEARPFGQPVPDQRCFVGGVVIHNQVDIQIGWDFGLDGVQELAELHRPVALVAAANHLAGLGVQRGKEGYRAVAQVVMGAPFRLPRAQGQQRTGAIQSLDLGLLVHAQHQRPLRRVQVQTHNIAHLPR